MESTSPNSMEVPSPTLAPESHRILVRGEPCGIPRMFSTAGLPPLSILRGTVNFVEYWAWVRCQFEWIMCQNISPMVLSLKFSETETNQGN